MWHYRGVLSQTRCHEWYQYMNARWDHQHIAADGSTTITNSSYQKLWYDSSAVKQILSYHQEYDFVPWSMITVPPAPGSSDTAVTPWVCDDDPVLWFMVALTPTVLHLRKRKLVEPCVYWRYSVPVVRTGGAQHQHCMQVSLHQLQDQYHTVTLDAGDVLVLTSDVNNWRCYQQHHQWQWLPTMYGYKKS